MKPLLGGDHVSQVVAPLLAAFTLPTIAVVVVTPPRHWQYVILAMFVASTGLLLASFQLSVGRLFQDASPWNEIRAVLTFVGLIFLAVGLALLAASARDADRTGLLAALAVLAAGVLVPIGMNISLWASDGSWRRWLWLWLTTRTGADRTEALASHVQQVLDRVRAIDQVELVGSGPAAAPGRSDWELRVTTRCLPAVMDRVPRLVIPLHPVIAQWDRLSPTWCYRLVLPGPSRVDITFDQPRSASGPWLVAAGTLRGIDDHFWDWTLRLSAGQPTLSDDQLAAELASMYRHLLSPLGVAAPPADLGQAVCDYRLARDCWEGVFGRPVPRAAENVVISWLQSR